MLRNLLLCGLLAGLCGGLLATGFARVVGETQINQAIAYEDAQYKAQGLPPEKPSSRAACRAAWAADCRGFTAWRWAGSSPCVCGRLGRIADSPARTSI
jgi:hypothetical protein